MTATGTFGWGPRYQGAAAYGLTGFPSVSWRAIGERDSFSAPDDSLDYTVATIGSFSFGPAVAFDFGRSTSDDRHLRGLQSIPWTIQPGIFAEYWTLENSVRARVEVRHGFRSDDGLVADGGVDWVKQVEHWTLSGGPRLRWGDSAYLRNNFGISIHEAEANGETLSFAPGPSFVSVGIAAAAAYAWTARWSTTAFGRYDREVAQAASGPITKTVGNENQFTLGISVARSFDILTSP